jgi:hypothetical protein
LPVVRTDPVTVEFAVDDPDGDSGPKTPIRIPGEPGRLEMPVVGAAAFTTGTVPGGQRSGFVQEKELRVPSRGHDQSAAPTELELADHPGAIAWCHSADDAAGRIMKQSAVPHEPAARWRGDQVAERSYAVLKRSADAESQWVGRTDSVASTRTFTSFANFTCLLRHAEHSQDGINSILANSPARDSRQARFLRFLSGELGG